MDREPHLPDSAGDRRNKRRVKMSQQVRVRPSDPIGAGFEEVQATINVSRDGLYFPTMLSSYRVGMQVLVTFPYSEMPGAINLEYVGYVVRVDKLTHGRWAIAVHLKSVRQPAAGK